ncbi:hypothetical protein GGD83_004953 [Rhodoblastus sphagnicola]|nr:hypothetical protein [Rhodoblastus sphagnicola]
MKGNDRGAPFARDADGRARFACFAKVFDQAARPFFETWSPQPDDRRPLPHRTGRPRRCLTSP